MPEAAAGKVGCLGLILSLLGLRPAAGTDEQEVASDGVLPYRVRDDFLSPAELSFYGVLRRAVGDRYAVGPKVRLSDVLFVAQPKVNQGYRNRIDRRHLDFLLCDSTTMRPAVAVELDDASHARPERQARDEFVDRALEAAGLRLVRFEARSGYVVAEVADRLALDGTANRQAAAASRAETAPAPVCPKCGGAMVLRTAGSGVHAGTQFWGCPNYPRCREKRPLELEWARQKG